jgi:TPR repeat protein
MKKYYLMAIELNDAEAMNNLGCYYKNIEKDYENAKKYYLMAIELNNSKAMFNLGSYYEKIEKDYENAKKYYLMAIELNYSDAMNKLAIYYEEIEKDYENAKKYYLMAIQLNNSDAMNNLGIYYQIIEKDYENMKKYYIMAIGLNVSGAMYNLEQSINKFELYDILKNLPPNEIINAKLAKLEHTIHVKNKIKFMQSLNNIKECPICYDTKLNIYFDRCCHQCCVDCYCKMDKCYYNCK